MHRIASIVVACLVVAGCNKEQTAASCRLDVARKWGVDALKMCIEPWSPFASRNATLPNPAPKCGDIDQATGFMRLCMSTAGYSLAEHCSGLRFEQFDRKCFTTSGPSQFIDAAAESELLSDTSQSPWTGYAWNKVEKRLEWVNSYETQAECVRTLRHITTDDTFNAQFYTEPIGCAYNGNSYWRVRIINAMWGGSELGCIAISGEPPEASKIGMLYGPVLGRGSPRPQGATWHCI